MKLKYAILADIHANLEALHAVLVDAKSQGCTHYVCLGDIVGYNADPKECLDIVRGMAMPCARGNHDEYCSNDSYLDGFNPAAAKAIEWARQQLTEEDRRWLRGLPLVLEVDGFTIVHATLDQPWRWGYVFDKHTAAANFGHQNTSLCFYGHTHIPIAFMKDSMVRGGTYHKFRIESGKQYFINPGAVGQPRDGNSKAAYVVYDVADQTIELRRVDYDIPGAQQKIKNAGLPPGLK